MKIVLVIDQYDIGNNGTTMSARNLVNALRERGHEVKIAGMGTEGKDKYVLPELKVPVATPVAHKQGMSFAKPVESILREAFLEKSGYKVLCFENGDLLYDKFKKDPADLVILDIMMPGTDGLSLCATLRKESSVPIIIVSAKGSDMERVAGITMGCDDYMAKPFSPIELVARVQAIFRRMAMMTPDKSSDDILVCGDLKIDKARREVTKDGKTVDLTPNEFNLISYLALNSARAVSRDELLKELWKFGSSDVDTRATDDAMKRLRRKLSECGSEVKIETVRGFGFRIG